MLNEFCSAFYPPQLEMSRQSHTHAELVWHPCCHDKQIDARHQRKVSSLRREHWASMGLSDVVILALRISHLQGEELCIMRTSRLWATRVVVQRLG